MNPPAAEFCNNAALTLALALAPLSVLSAFSIGFLIAPITAVVVLLGGPGLHVEPDVLATERLLGVALGCSVGLLTGVLVLPARASRLAVEAAARVAGLLAAQLRAITPGDGTGEDALAARGSKIRQELIELAIHATEAARERRLSFGLAPDPERVLRRVRYDVGMLRRAGKGASVDALPAALAGPWQRAVTGAAGTLTHVDGLLRGKLISGPTAPLEPVVRDYRATLDAMRQAGLTRTLSTSHLGRLFGIEFVLRQLERDLADLTNIAQDFSGSRRPWWR